MSVDPYSVLGVDRKATQEEIKKAYRKKAHQHHPDKKGGDEARFKEINEAYQVLGNEERRSRFDRYGDAGADGGFQGGGYQDFGQGFGGMGGFESIFDMFSGGFASTATQRPQKGEDLHLNVHASTRDLGKQKMYEFEAFDACVTCEASGVAPGSKRVPCEHCQGQGRVRQSVRTPFGTFAQVIPCVHCEAEGTVPEKVCSTCGGTGRTKVKRKLEVHLPKKIDGRYLMAFPKGGNAGPRGAPEGDLSITVTVS